jgi:hypothetical protein
VALFNNAWLLVVPHGKGAADEQGSPHCTVDSERLDARVMGTISLLGGAHHLDAIRERYCSAMNLESQVHVAGISVDPHDRTILGGQVHDFDPPSHNGVLSNVGI